MCLNGPESLYASSTYTSTSFGKAMPLYFVGLQRAVLHYSRYTDASSAASGKKGLEGGQGPRRGCRAYQALGGPQV